MASGRGVVATRVGGLPDLVRDDETGILVPPRDAPGLARAIVRGLDEAQALGAAARRAAQRLDWDGAAATITELAATAICGARGPC
jgi:glycosyltransferase involved in cell wall biosynthesis